MVKIYPLLLLAIVSVLAACSEEVPKAPVIEVIVDDVTLQPYQPNSTFVGHLQAQDDVRIQARVSGYLKSRHFKEGDLIEKGALLYQIDPAHYEASYAQAKADNAKANAAKEVADLNLLRGQELAPVGAISASELDKITATKLQASAEVQASLARLQSAKVDLGYTTITAPIAGRIGRSEITTGDLIGPDSGVLTTLVSIDPINATFQVGEATYLIQDEHRRKMMNDGREAPKLTVKLELSNREIYPLTGYIDYIANHIDETTGTIELRAVIPNSEGLLRPGQYVKIIIETSYNVDTLMLPQMAVQADQQGSFVLIVDSSNNVQRRNVELGDRVGHLVVANKGVNNGDKVIVRGLQKVRPGLQVTYQELAKQKTAAEILRVQQQAKPSVPTDKGA